jgi:LEA14-like dessication related protein
MHTPVRNILTASILLGLALMLGGCTVFSKAKVTLVHFVSKPSAKIIELKGTEITEQGERVELSILVQNPNDVSLPLEEASYDVRLSDGRQFSFVDRPHRTLSPDGQQQLVLPASFARSQEPISGQEYHISGWVSYEPPGALRKILTRAGWPLPRTSFAGSGRLK